jgi:hypothetical protein
VAAVVRESDHKNCHSTMTIYYSNGLFPADNDAAESVDLADSIVVAIVFFLACDLGLVNVLQTESAAVVVVVDDGTEQQEQDVYPSPMRSDDCDDVGVNY